MEFGPSRACSELGFLLSMDIGRESGLIQRRIVELQGRKWMDGRYLDRSQHDEMTEHEFDGIQTRCSPNIVMREGVLFSFVRNSFVR